MPTTQTQQDLPNQILNTLIGLSQNANPVGNATNMAVQQGINMGQQAAPTLGPLMGEVSKKVLTKYFTGHAENLLATNPQQGAQILAAHIQPGGGEMGGKGASGSWDGQSEQGSSPQLYNSTSANNQMQNAQSPTGQFQQGLQPPPTQTMQSPQSQQGINPLQVLGNLLHTFSQGAGQAMMNSAGVGQFQNQQAQSGLMRQQTQNITPGQPLTPENQANMNIRQQEVGGQIYGRQLEGAKQSLESIKAQQDELEKQAEESTKQATAAASTLSPIGKNFGSGASIRNTMQNQMATINIKRQQLMASRSQAEMRLAYLMDNVPNFQQSKNQTSSGSKSTSTPFQVGQSYNGEVIKSVKRVG